MVTGIAAATAAPTIATQQRNDNTTETEMDGDGRCNGNAAATATAMQRQWKVTMTTMDSATVTGSVIATVMAMAATATKMAIKETGAAHTVRLQDLNPHQLCQPYPIYPYTITYLKTTGFSSI